MTRPERRMRDVTGRGIATPEVPSQGEHMPPPEQDPENKPIRTRMRSEYNPRFPRKPGAVHTSVKENPNAPQERTVPWSRSEATAQKEDKERRQSTATLAAKPPGKPPWKVHQGQAEARQRKQKITSKEPTDTSTTKTTTTHFLSTHTHTWWRQAGTRHEHQSRDPHAAPTPSTHLIPRLPRKNPPESSPQSLNPRA